MPSPPSARRWALSRLLALGFGLWALVFASPAFAQEEDPDGVPALLTRLEGVLLSSDPSRFATLLSPNAPAGLDESFGADLFFEGATRVIIRERERSVLSGALPGDGFRLLVEVFVEASTLGRIQTARLDVRRPRNDISPEAWRIVGGKMLTQVRDLHRLAVDVSRQFAARQFTLHSEDLSLTLVDGSMFMVRSRAGVSGVVMIGRGLMEFAPAPRSEREQLRLFGGSESLRAEFETAFVRLNPASFNPDAPGSGLTPLDVDPRQLRRAIEVFTAELPKSFSIDLGDLTRDQWHLVPSPGDFLAEVRTRRHGALTYTRSQTEAEDVTLVERSRGRDLARYASAAKLATRGVFYNEDDLTDYDVLDYDITATVTPAKSYIDGQARLLIVVRAAAMMTMNIRLAESLIVTSVESPDLGRLSHFRVRGRDSIVLSLPLMLRKGSEFTLNIVYAGTIQPQSIIDQEAQQQGPTPSRPDMLIEPNFLLSSRGNWYPQAPVSDYATATLRITVPSGFECVASGEFESVTAAEGSAGGRSAPRTYVFGARDPVRYLTVLVSRFRNQGKLTVPLAEESSAKAASAANRQAESGVRSLTLTMETNPRQQGHARGVSAAAADIIRFYASLMGGTPYDGLTVAMVESELPGGHSPAYLVMLNSPPAGFPFSPRNDPASFHDYPEYVLAHELAHQWWGHAVGWKNYHEQWLSEGMAQYFAALYAERRHGSEAFSAMLRQFRRWAISESDQGPIYLGYRLGQIRGDKRVLRAVMYNKGASVLHMLRRMLGDDVFFASLRRLYNERKFDKAGTDDLMRAFEAESGRSLGRFFERWVFESLIPRVRYRWTAAAGEVVVQFEQRGDEVFDIPVTVTVNYGDGRSVDVMVPLTEKSVEHRIPAQGAVRNVQINRDVAALAEFEQE